VAGCGFGGCTGGSFLLKVLPSSFSQSMGGGDQEHTSDAQPSLGVEHINAHGKEHHAEVMECSYLPHKGRILTAKRAFNEGDIILVEHPLHIVQEDESSAAFKHLQGLCKTYSDDFDYDPLWFWCALQSLTGDQLHGAKFGGWKGTDAATQRNLLLLHHDEVHESGSSSDILARELAPGADPITIERLTQIWVLNCFEYSDDPQGYSTYFFSSFMSHSCWPNAVWHYSGADHVLRARRTIEVGDEVTISYLPEHGLMQAAPLRRLELHDTKRFWCTCERCTGAQDLSRGFKCPRCEEGKVFSKTPEPGPAKDGALSSQHLVGVLCASCGQALSKRDALRLAGHEKKLNKLVEDYTSRKHGSKALPDSAEAQAVEDFIDSVFVQHALADLAWEQLAECHGRKRRYTKQRRLLERRCSFHASAYEGLNGSHAWMLEATGDAMLHSSVSSKASGHKNGKAKVWQATAKVDPQEACRLYSEAFAILSLMFGDDHEYARQVERKRCSAQKALEVLGAAEAAPGSAQQKSCEPST